MLKIEILKMLFIAFLVKLSHNLIFLVEPTRRILFLYLTYILINFFHFLLTSFIRTYLSLIFFLWILILLLEYRIIGTKFTFLINFGMYLIIFNLLSFLKIFVQWISTVKGVDEFGDLTLYVIAEWLGLLLVLVVLVWKLLRNGWWWGRGKFRWRWGY